MILVSILYSFSYKAHAEYNAILCLHSYSFFFGFKCIAIKSVGLICISHASPFQDKKFNNCPKIQRHYKSTTPDN